MSERGKARYALISAGSNTTVKTGSGSLYGLYIRPANGASVRVEDAANLGAAPDLNNPSASSIALLGTYASAAPDVVTFTPGIGFNDGLTVAASSNTRITVVYE